MNKSLTLVLPVHNAESHLRKNVLELLEVASGLTSKFNVLVVDDGSTDATFEVAQELAGKYPQVSLMRHRVRRGLGATFEYVERRVRADAVFVHDGVTPIDAEQMRRTWREWITRTDSAAPANAPRTTLGDVVSLPALHASMERVHRRVVGFQPVTTAEHALSPAPFPLAEASNARTDRAHSADPSVGRIPRFPRPKFLSALANFAWGE